MGDLVVLREERKQGGQCWLPGDPLFVKQKTSATRVHEAHPMKRHADLVSSTRPAESSGHSVESIQRHLKNWKEIIHTTEQVATENVG